MIKLYIGEKELEIDSKTSIVISKRFDDLQNPAGTKNDSSITVSLPATNHNNSVFEHIWRIDHVVMSFDPSKRSEFVLTRNGAVIQSGYMKINSIGYNNQYPHSYNVTLFGKRGDFINDICADYDNGDQRILGNLRIDPANYTHNITKEAVVDSFTNEHYRYCLTYSGQYDNFDADKIFKEFSGTSYQMLDMAYGNGTLFALITNGYLLSTDNGETFRTYLSENVGLPETFAESAGVFYTQDRFYIYSGTRLFESSNPASGDEWILTWTSSFGDLLTVNVAPVTTVRFGFAFITSQGYYAVPQAGTTFAEIVNSSGFAANSSVSLSRWSSNGITEYGIVSSISGYWMYEIGTAASWDVNPGNGDPASFGFSNNAAYPDTATAPNTVMLLRGTILSDAPGELYYATKLTSNNPNSYSWEELFSQAGISSMNICDNGVILSYGFNGRILRISAGPGGDTLVWTEYFNNIGNTAIQKIIWGDGYYYGITVSASGEYRFIRTNHPFLEEWIPSEGIYDEIDSDDLNEHQRNEFRSYYQRPALRFKDIFTQILEDSGWEYTLYPEFFNENNPYWEKTWLIMARLQYDGEPPESNQGNIRSGDQVTFEMMIPNGELQYNFFNTTVQTYGLMYTVDPIRKNVNIMTRNEYFRNYKVLDWTERIDYSNRFEIIPLPFDYKYGIFTYDNASSYYEDRYYEKYFRRYGWTRVDTGYDFNSNEKAYINLNIFQNVVMSTEVDREFEGRLPDIVKDGKTVPNYLDDKTLPALFTKSNGQMSYNDSTMHLVFIDGLTTLPNPIRITDDNPDMPQLGLFMWNDAESNSITISAIPNVSRLANEYTSLFRYVVSATPTTGTARTINTPIPTILRIQYIGDIETTIRIYKDDSRAELLYQTNEKYIIYESPYESVYVYVNRINNGEYWNQGDIISVDSAKIACSLDYSKPSNIYYQGEYPDDIAIYDRFYKRYVEEISYVNNNLLDCYANLNYLDMTQFEFSNFIKNKNVLYHPIEIHKYDVSDRRSTQVQMLRVHDIDAYVSGQDVPGSSGSMTMSATQDVEFFEETE